MHVGKGQSLSDWMVPWKPLGCQGQGWVWGCWRCLASRGMSALHSRWCAAIEGDTEVWVTQLTVYWQQVRACCSDAWAGGSRVVLGAVSSAWRKLGLCEGSTRQ